MRSVMQTIDLCRDFQSGGEIVHAVKNINIDIEKSKLTILKGRSGAGKTTLINLLAAMDIPSSGKIILNEEDLSSFNQHQKDELRRDKFGICFQSGGLLSNLTAYENVELGLKIAGYNKKDISNRIKECLDIVGLYKRRMHYPYELSGGEAQRIAIARAIAHKPEIVFMDEPTSALDTKTAVKVVKVFIDMIEKEKLTIVMTTHDPNMMEIADKVYALSDGVIIDE